MQQPSEQPTERVAEQTAQDPPETASHVLLSVNPKAGRRSSAERVARLEEALVRGGLRVEKYTDLAEVAARANQLHGEQTLRALVGIGGDGTAAELVNRTDDGVPVSLLATGTANLLSKQLGLSRKPEKLAETIVLGQRMRLDAGRANGRIFLLMAGCGFDADVVRRVHTRRESNPKGPHISYFSYLKPIFQSIRGYQYPELRVTVDASSDGTSDENTTSFTTRWAFVFNLPRYGWGLGLTPKAVATDGLLDLCALSRGSLFHGLRYAAAAQMLGYHQRLRDCRILQARRLRITSEEEVAYQLDGDPASHLPLEIEVVPNRLTLIVPPGCPLRA